MPEKQRRAQSDDGYQNRIRVLRKKFGLKQDALAAAACVDRAYLSRIERGKRPGSIGALNRIADALGVPLSELFANGGGESLFSAMFAEIFAGTAGAGDGDAACLCSGGKKAAAMSA